MTLSALRGRPVVLAFFPAAFSSVCQKELCTFRDSLAELNRANAQVFGISVDTFFALKAFHDQQKLTFPLLSDFNKQVIRDYGVFNEDMIGLKGIAKRAVFVLDKDGVVRHREVLEDARNEPDYARGVRRPGEVVGMGAESAPAASRPHLSFAMPTRAGADRPPREDAGNQSEPPPPPSGVPAGSRQFRQASTCPCSIT